MQGQERIHLHTQHHKTGRPVMCKLPFSRLTNNHDYPRISRGWMKQINQNMTTQEAIEVEIDFKSWPSCGLFTIKAHCPNLFSTRLKITPPFKANEVIDNMQQSD